MKCEKCGANLQIDNAFCPYCGTPNKVARKHRQDLAKYSEDYENTKDEVLSNSRKFNRKNLRITAVAITFATGILLAFYAYKANDLRWERRYKMANIKETEWVSQLDNYIYDKDYLGFYEYSETENVRYVYKTTIYAYQEAKNISSYFYSFYNYVLSVYTGEKTYSSYNYAMYINDYLNYIYKANSRLENDSSIPDNIKQYIAACAEDSEKLLSVYLGLSENEINELRYLDDSKRQDVIKEGVYRIYEKK